MLLASPHRHKKRRVSDREKALQLEARAAAAGQVPQRRSNLQGWLGSSTGPLNTAGVLGDVLVLVSGVLVLVGGVWLVGGVERCVNDVSR